MMNRLTSLTIAVVLILSGVAMGQWYWPPSAVVIRPANPVLDDEIRVVLEGRWSDACVPTGLRVARGGQAIYVDVLLDYPPGTLCAEVISPWRQEGKVGRLQPGTYTVFGRIAENELVPSTEYIELTKFTVDGPGQTTVYHFISEESIVTQTGGFAGVNEMYDVSGSLALQVNHDLGTARFVDVDATLSPESGFLPTTSLGTLFNLELLQSTGVDEKAFRLVGVTQDDAKVVVEGVFIDVGIRLLGWIRPECCDRFNYELDGFAVAVGQSICRKQPRMDFNGDCRVDMADLAIFAESWLECNLLPEIACWE